jgi:hypothetical protein
VRSLDAAELLRALGVAIAGLRREADQVRELAGRVEPRLRELTGAWEPDADASPAGEARE